MGKRRYSTYSFLTSALDGVSGEYHAHICNKTFVTFISKNWLLNCALLPQHTCYITQHVDVAVIFYEY
jgi:hypothetical protein